jgi:hypothetical protein
MKLFVTFDGETKKIELEEATVVELKKAICAKCKNNSIILIVLL